jgi:hypothetical protein
MNTTQKKSFYEFMEQLSAKWWLYLFLVLCVFIPPYTARGFSTFSEIVSLVKYVADYLIDKKLVLVPYMPIFHIVFILLFVLLVIYRNKFGRLFSLVAGFHFIFILSLQAIAVTEKYGLVFYPNAFVLISLIPLGWFWEARIRKIDFSFRKLPLKYYWVVLVAIFSFWNPDEFGNYSPILLLTSTSPIAFCMSITIYLAALSLLYPNVNLPFFRISSFITILVGIIVIGMGFFMEDRIEGIYWSFLHTPMLVTAVYCFILGFQTWECQPKNSNE